MGNTAKVGSSAKSGRQLRRLMRHYTLPAMHWAISPCGFVFCPWPLSVSYRCGLFLGWTPRETARAWHSSKVRPLVFFVAERAGSARTAIAIVSANTPLGIATSSRWLRLKNTSRVRGRKRADWFPRLTFLREANSVSRCPLWVMNGLQAREPMSALPPKRTSGGWAAMSAKCQYGQPAATPPNRVMKWRRRMLAPTL